MRKDAKEDLLRRIKEAGHEGELLGLGAMHKRSLNGFFVYIHRNFPWREFYFRHNGDHNGGKVEYIVTVNRGVYKGP